MQNILILHVTFKDHFIISNNNYTQLNKKQLVQILIEHNIVIALDSVDEVYFLNEKLLNVIIITYENPHIFINHSSDIECNFWESRKLYGLDYFESSYRLLKLLK